MRKVRFELIAKVPTWHFCNNDKLNLSPIPTKETCQFCKTDRYGRRYCMIFDEGLMEKDGLIYKPSRCIDAVNASFDRSAGPARAEHAEPPVVDPKDIIHETIELYRKTLNGLLDQGYPQKMAEKFAQQYVEGSK